MALPTNPALKRADAVYFDPELSGWRAVTHEADRETIARLAAQGVLSITSDQSLWPENQIYY